MNPVRNKLYLHKLHLLALMTLTACGPLVKIGESGPPPQRFTLVAAPNTAAVVALPTLRVDDLESAAELANTRIAVRVGAQEVRYVTGGLWTDRPTRLLRAVLADTLRQRSTGLVLSAAQADIAPAYRLAGRLIAFQAEAPNGVVTHMKISTEQLLIMAKTGTVLASRRFEAREASRSDRPADLAEAANAAANIIAAQTTDWVSSQLLQAK
jgi:cholesterol transport system auxiliary component